jgi:hypothetical protein
VATAVIAKREMHISVRASYDLNLPAVEMTMVGPVDVRPTGPGARVVDAESASIVKVSRGGRSQVDTTTPHIIASP